MTTRLLHRMMIGMVVAFSVFFSISPALAQDDLPQQFTLANGFAIRTPADWEFEIDKDSGFYMIFDERATATVFDPLQAEDVLDLPANYTLEDALTEAYRWIYNERIRNAAIEELDLGGRRALAITREFEYEGTNYSEWVVAIELAPGENGFLYFYTPAERMGTQMTLWRQIASSFGPLDNMPQAISAGAASGGSCTISTTSANTVQLRVGPGYNRSSVAFLPAGQPFVVTGSNTAADGSEWFQLDKSEAAPQSAASEIWVAREDVDESGACDSIGTVAAPPVVPIVNQPPPAASGGEAAAPADPGALPREGVWTINYDPVTRASCEGTENFNFDTLEQFDALIETVFVDVQNNGQTLRVGGDVLNLVAPGSYFGNFDDGSGYNAQFRLQVTSATSMTGSLVGNQSFDGVPCSATLFLSMRYSG